MMKICLGIVLSVSAAAVGQTEGQAGGSTRPEVSSSVIDPQEVRVLRLHPGYATSLRMPEEISSVVIGNPSDFKAEHSESEPRLVFIKPITKEPAESNALITTKSGHTVSLQLVSAVSSGSDPIVDFVVEYRQSRSLLIEESAESSFTVGETRSLSSEVHQRPSALDNETKAIQHQLAKQ